MSKQEFILTQVIGVTKSNMNSPEKNFFMTKIFLAVALYTFLITNAMLNMVSPEYVPECIRDEAHEATLPITNFLENNPFYRNALIITASLMLDICAFTLAMRFVLYDRNYKMGLVGITFYILRGVLQSIFFMKFPSNYIWGHPGLFSVTVPYAPANDFFYSGHVGICTICLIHFKRDGLKFMTPFAFITLIVEFFTLLVTRAHYFVDLVTGIIVAHYLYLVGDWIEEYLDKRKKEKEINSVKLSPAFVTNGASGNTIDGAKLQQTAPLINGKKKKKEKTPSPKSKNRVFF